MYGLTRFAHDDDDLYFVEANGMPHEMNHRGKSRKTCGLGPAIQSR